MLSSFGSPGAACHAIDDGVTIARPAAAYVEEFDPIASVVAGFSLPQ